MSACCKTNHFSLIFSHTMFLFQNKKKHKKKWVKWYVAYYYGQFLYYSRVWQCTIPSLKTHKNMKWFYIYICVCVYRLRVVYSLFCTSSFNCDCFDYIFLDLQVQSDFSFLGFSLAVLMNWIFRFTVRDVKALWKHATVMGSRCLNKGLQLPEDSSLCNKITIRSLHYTETFVPMHYERDPCFSQVQVYVVSFLFYITFYIYALGKWFYPMKLTLHLHYEVHFIS